MDRARCAYIFIVLLSIAGLSPNVSSAGTLAGDWYLEDTEDASIDKRRAFSQPKSQSIEAIQVTLGITSPGLVDLVDFYWVISSKTTDPNCQYTVNEIVIDSGSFPMRGSTRSSDTSHITTRSVDEQERLWSEFRKGQNLSLRIHQVCNVQNEPSSVINTFDFSLKGSSAAYRFVIGQEAVDNRNQEAVKTTEPVGAPESEDAEITVAGESGLTTFIQLLVALFIVALIVRSFKWQAEPNSMDSTFEPASERLDPKMGDHLQAVIDADKAATDFQNTPETNGVLLPGKE